VVPNFYDVGAQIYSACEEARFARLAGVAHEELAKIFVMQHRDDAVLVDVVAGIREYGQRWRENVDRHAVIRPPAATLWAYH
jgi:hypothetical protein